MTIRAVPLPFDAAAPATVVSPASAARRCGGCSSPRSLGGWGVQWDIQWHVLIGRDSFWIAPHLMTYAGVGLSVLLSWGVLAWESLLAGRGRTGADGVTIRLLGLTGTRGFHLAAWGIALTVLAAPIDDLWHRLFGLDVTIWSPPHLLGIFGAAVNTVGCLLIATEVYAAERGRRLLATILFGAMLYGTLHLVVDPSNLVAYRRGGVFFYTLAILSALILPSALVTTARVARTRWAPVLVLLVIIPMGIVGREDRAARLRLARARVRDRGRDRQGLPVAHRAGAHHRDEERHDTRPDGRRPPHRSPSCPPSSWPRSIRAGARGWPRWAMRRRSSSRSVSC